VLRVRNTLIMERTRTILKLLMDKAGDTPYDVQRKIGVPRTTTWRFISGGHNEPRSSTIQKWAKLYNVTESQLRGDVPIDGMVFKESPKELKDILPLEEYKHVSNIKKMSSEARLIMYKLSAMLADKREISSLEIVNTKNVTKNSLRAGKERYQSPAKKSRIKDISDNATKQTGTS
jgi:transcriptional regulator with XRE-family HTH domain